jgi:hypothetical protein
MAEMPVAMAIQPIVAVEKLLVVMVSPDLLHIRQANNQRVL